MIIVGADSPWYPLAVAQVLAMGRPIGVYQPRFEHWLNWRYHFELHGPGFRRCTDEEAAMVLRPPA